MKMTALSNVCVFLYFSFFESMRNEQKRYGNIDQLLRDTNCQIKGFIEKKVKNHLEIRKQKHTSTYDLLFLVLHSSKNWKKASPLISIVF